MRRIYTIPLLFILTICFFSCKPDTPSTFQGYLEGDYVYMASPYGGYLKDLHVVKGQKVTKGMKLFTLDATLEGIDQIISKENVDKAEAQLADLKKGKRPTELAELEADVKRLQAAFELAKIDYERNSKLYKQNAVSKKEMDRSSSTYNQSTQQLAEAKSKLATAELGARSDQVAAAEDQVKTARLTSRKSDWIKAQKTQSAVQNGKVSDILYRKGEWVPPGKPVIQMLPTTNLKLRFFVSPEVVNQIEAGIQVSFNSGWKDVKAKINFISDRAEFTPPVIYSKECREKLVYMIEAEIAPEDAINLNAGKPVDVIIPGLKKKD